MTTTKTLAVVFIGFLPDAEVTWFRHRECSNFLRIVVVFVDDDHHDDDDDDDNNYDLTVSDNDYYKEKDRDNDNNSRRVRITAPSSCDVVT
jgi:hypothetical protein